MKEGYKQTDIGVIPEDWDVQPFEKVLKRKNVKNHQIQTKKYLESGRFPVVDQGKSKVVAYSDNTHKVYKVDDNGVIIFGDHTCITKFIDFDFIVGADGTQIICSINNTVTRFINYDLENAPIISTGYNRHLKKLKERLFVCPKPEEQKAIAAVLSDVDGLIESLEQLMAKKCDMKTAAMQQLLTGKKRLPGFDGVWEEKKLGDLVIIRNQKVNTLNNPIAQYCIELENIASGRGTVLFSSDSTDRNSTKYIFKKGDVLFGRLRPYLKKFWNAEREGVCSTEIWPLMPVSKDFLPSFLAQLVRMDEFIAKACESYGTHMPRADWKVLGEMEIFLPKPEEQKAIATVLSDMDAEIDALEQRLEKNRRLKTGMMQELLTGRTRLIKTHKKEETA